MELFLESGEKAGLYDVCKWFIKTYPADIFITSPPKIVAIRADCEELLLIRDKGVILRHQKKSAGK